MAVEVNYMQAVRLFLQHLKASNMTQRWLKSFERTFKGSFKRFIAGELIVYPLSLDKIRNLYSKNRQYAFTYSLKSFHSFIHGNPHLTNGSFGHAFSEMEALLSELSKVTLRNIKKDVLKIITIDIDELAVSQIPDKVIRDCMRSSSNFTFVRGRRFFKFLIHGNMLDSKYLPVYASKIRTFIEQSEQGPLSYQAAELPVDRLNVEQACRVFLNHLCQENTLRYEAVRTLYYHISSFSQFLGPRKKISAITRDEIIGYLNHLEIEHSYSPSSKAAVLTTLRSFFRFLATQKLIKHNPTGNIRVKKVKKIDKTAFSEEELTLILTAAYLNYQQYENLLTVDSTLTLKRWLAARDWAIICLLICTGLRSKEIASLKTDSIDFRERVINIEGKGDSTYRIRERIIPLTEPVALSAVEIYLRLRPASIFDHLFLSARIEPLKTCGFAKVVKNMKKKLFPQKRLTITQIRKSFISLCAQKGIDDLILRKIMGHSSLATTMRYYLTVREQYLKEVWEKNNPLLYFSKREFEEWTI